MPKQYQLSQVFGNWQDSTAPTYVERSRFDNRLKYYLTTADNVIIHGGSRQGKTMLRKRNISEDKSIVINCTHGTTAIQILDAALRAIGADYDIDEIQTGRTQENNRSAQGKASFNAGVAKADLDGHIGKSNTRESSYTRSPLSDHDSVVYRIELLGQSLKDDRKRIILDDFHFLDRNVQAEISGYLKTLQEEGVLAVVVGVWQESQALAKYNSQIRTVDINIDWTNAELEDVLQAGCEALNIALSSDISEQVIADANQSISLLQNLMEALCIKAGIFYTQDEEVLINDMDLLEGARRDLCESKLGQYKEFFRLIVQNVRITEESLRMYERIMQVCVTQATDLELLQGIPSARLREWIRPIEERVRTSDVTQALQRINGLQDKRDFSEIVFYYDDHVLKLVDRDLLFYRRYNNSPYPWDQEQDD